MNIEGKHLKFRLVQVSDANLIFGLRMNTELNKYLSKIDVDVGKQIDWIMEYKHREEEGIEYYYILEDKEFGDLGTVRIYDFVNKSFCWGSWIIKRERPTYAAVESALLVYENAFYDLGFDKSHFHVMKKNKRVIEFHRRFGAKIVDKDSENYYFSFSKDNYELMKSHYEKFL